MSEKRYFVTDLDGTLLDSTASLSSYTQQVVSMALSDGHVVSFATARSMVSARPRVDAIEWIYPAIVYNGAVLMHPLTGKPMKSFFLDSSIAAVLLHKGKSFGLANPFLFLIDSAGAERVLYLAPVNEGQNNFLQSRRGDPRFQRVESLSIPSGHNMIQFNYIGRKEELRPFHDWIVKSYKDRVKLQFVPDTYLAGFYSLEIYHPEASKKDSLLLWAGELGCTPTDITVFGDNLNDLDLFEAAGRSVAVANAHPDVLRAADEVIAGNDEDGVAKYLAKQLGYTIPAGQRSVS